MSGRAGLASLCRGIGGRVRAAREMQKLSQRELSRAVGLTPSGMSLLEAGKRLPSAFVLLALARALRVSSDYLLGLKEPHR